MYTLSGPRRAPGGVRVQWGKCCPSSLAVDDEVVGDGVDPVAIGFVRVPLDASLAVNTL